MILMRIAADVLPGKYNELKLTVSDLRLDLEKEHGCKSYLIYKSIHHRSIICLLSEWEDKKSLQSHMNSKLFAILSGAIRNLCENATMDVNTRSSTCNFNNLTASPAIT